MDTPDENIIRKKSSFLKDGSYRIFHVTKKDSDDEDNRNHNDEMKTDKLQKKSSKIKNRNGLKQFLFLHKTSCELSSNEGLTPPLIHERHSIVPENLLEKSKNDVSNETKVHNHLVVHPVKFEPQSRKQVLIPIRPEIQASFHRRRKRFIVACGTVMIALTVIITIIIYVIIMTIKHRTQMSQHYSRNHPR